MVTMASTMDPTTVAAAVVALTIVYFVWCKLRNRLETIKPFEKLPMPPGSHWLFGHFSMFSNDFIDTHQKMCYDFSDEYGICSFWLLGNKGVTVTHWQDVRAILQSSVDHMIAVGIMRKHFNKFIGKQNIGVMNGKQWKYHRSAILRVFHSQTTLENSRNAMVDVATTLVESLKQKQEQPVEMDVDPLMKMITMDVFGRTALSCDFECCKNLEPSPFAVAFDFLGAEALRRLRNPLLPTNAFYSIPTATNQRHARERKVIRDFLQSMIETRRQELPEKRQPDLLTSLLKAHEEMDQSTMSDQSMMDEMLVDNMMALLFAGFDTTSITLMYALYLVATHPEAESKCLQEIQRVETQDGNLLDPARLVYIGGVVQETLRMYPPAFVVSRKVTKPLQLSNGFIIPEDVFVLIPIFKIQHDPKHFERPEEFHPERWVKQNDGNDAWVEREMTDTSPASEIPPGNRNAIFAFSGGARSCAAQKFAIQEAVLVLATLLKDLKFQAKPGYVPVPMRNGIVQSPVDGMPMTISAR